MKKLSLLVGGAIFATATVSAYMDIDDRLDVLEKEMQEISARNPQGTLGVSFVTSRPEVDGTNWYLALDVIYWHPKMGGTEYAITHKPNQVFDGTLAPPFALVQNPHGGLKENDFSWDLGIKVGLGYKTPHDKWDVFARYTWFETHSSSQTHKNFPSTIIPLKVSLPSPFQVLSGNQLLGSFAFYSNKAKSTVDIHYNNVDLELSRSFFISKNLSIKPHCGLKAAWIDLSQKIAYIQESKVDVESNLFDLSSPEAKVSLTSKFKSLGPRIGLDSKYYLGNNIYLTGDIAGSILYGHFKARQKDFIPDFDLGGLFPEISDSFEDLFNLVLSAPSRSITSKFHRFIPFVQAQIGLEWDKYFNNKKQHLGFRFGYEVQYYWRVNQMEEVGNILGVGTPINVSFNPPNITVIPRGRYHNDFSSRDLMFYGITGEVRLDF